MKQFFTALIFALSSLTLIAQHQGTQRQIIHLNQDWKFFPGDIARAYELRFNDASWEAIQLPHDWAIGQPFSHDLPANTGKLPWKGVGWYRKKIRLDHDVITGKKLILMVDGIMSHPEIYVNGQLAGSWDYGYNSFYLDITSLIRSKQENLIAIKADTRKMDSRWYPGAGIYRKIDLHMMNPLHFQVWGNQITTPDVTEQYARIRVNDRIEVPKDLKGGFLAIHSILSPAGDQIMADTTYIDASAQLQGIVEVEHWFTLPYPKLWCIDHPVLYSMKANILVNGITKDETLTPFGIRYFEFDAEQGFFLNGKHIKLKGVNLHHDHGPLGAKFYPRAMHRQLQMMKEMGVNAIRTSHNTFAPELLAMCDTMGLLVYNEIFDKWNMTAGIRPETDFDEFMERNIANFMKRDRNHPSIIIWGMGNEMTDVQYNENGGLRKLQKVMNIARRYDHTRPITIANDRTDGVLWRHFDHYDLHCWNYGRRYIPAREMDPGSAVIISESASTLSTRGYYELPLPASPTDFSDKLQVSSYDLNAPVWAEIADYDFYWQDVDRYVAGEFVWTGFDYLGEPTPYNDEAVAAGKLAKEQTARSSFFGIMDLCGIPKDRYWLYQSHWKPNDTIVHILPHWNWEGTGIDTVPVFVYTTGSCAELFLNGRSLGIQCKQPLEQDDIIRRYRLIWDHVPYEPGTLTAVAWRDGRAMGQSEMKTAGRFSRLRLRADRQEIQADGADLSYILVEALDDEGILCPLEDARLDISIEGVGVIEGLCNGDPHSFEPFSGSYTVRLFHGKAMITVRSLFNEPGEIEVSVESGKVNRVIEKIVSR